MQMISKDALQALQERYPKGTRVELVQMDDPFNNRLVPGCRGTVMTVDAISTIHVAWDCGSSLGIVYGVDSCRIISDPDPAKTTK